MYPTNMYVYLRLASVAFVNFARVASIHANTF